MSRIPGTIEDINSAISWCDAELIIEQNFDDFSPPGPSERVATLVSGLPEYRFVLKLDSWLLSKVLPLGGQ